MRPTRHLALLAVALGGWLMLAPVLLGYATTSRAVFNDVLVGVLAIGAGLWRSFGLRGGRLASLALILLGLTQAVSPWVYAQTLPAARWSAWVTGVLLIGIGALTSRQQPGDRPPHGLYALPDLLPDADPEREAARRLAARRQPPRRRRRERDKPVDY